MTDRLEIMEIVNSLNQKSREIGALLRVGEFDIWSDLEASEARAEREVTLLQPWLNASDMALQILYSLHRYALSLSVTDSRPPSLPMLLGRACNMQLAVRTLVTRGLDEPARVIARSLRENLDIALVTLADTAFAVRYFEANDPKRFWRDEIARGAIHTKAEQVYAQTGVVDMSFREARKEQWKRLSEATHASRFSAFAGATAVSLADGGLVPSPLGYIGIRGPAILAGVASDTHDFMVTVMRLSLLPTAPLGFERSHFDRAPQLVLASGAYFVLQELLNRHRHTLMRSTGSTATASENDIPSD